MAELSEYYEIERELAYASPMVFGGSESCERCMIRFGNPEILGYEEDFPIVILEIKPVAMKFADDLNHRDFLGALMNLGINRNTLGDIKITGKSAILFCRDSMKDYIIENLIKVKHTSISINEIRDVGEIGEVKTKEKVIQLSSARIDAVISKAYNLSRNASLELFRTGKVYLNGRECSENAKTVVDNDIISVRGYGKMQFKACESVSRKGKLNCIISMFV
ncbi:MAG: YlmH/Sll1252 family protein [Lachnospiraceae bacterium]|nr:YlmH/Sll1252 family protein [Lachnospiraceae bacterium]